MAAELANSWASRGKETTTFVQQLKRQNAPRANNSLFLWEQGVAPFSGVVCAQNSGTIRATRSIGRGTVCPEAEPSGFMNYDLKA